MNVIFTSSAKKSYEKNIAFLEDFWNKKVVQDFIIEVEGTLNIVSKNPNCFPDWDYDHSFKKGFINKRISFYYKIKPNEIVIYLFWNNYLNPDKLVFQLFSQ